MQTRNMCTNPSCVQTNGEPDRSAMWLSLSASLRGEGEGEGRGGEREGRGGGGMGSEGREGRAGQGRAGDIKSNKYCHSSMTKKRTYENLPNIIVLN